MNAIGAGGKAIEVLVLEDSPGHVRLTQEAFRHANRLIQFTWRSTASRPWRSH
ncbi:MAG: hypothetical protein ABSF69_23395 [Polyangiaceae bacterium]|jgi:hypothetical protein